MTSLRMKSTAVDRPQPNFTFYGSLLLFLTLLAEVSGMVTDNRMNLGRVSRMSLCRRAATPCTRESVRHSRRRAGVPRSRSLRSGTFWSVYLRAPLRSVLITRYVSLVNTNRSSSLMDRSFLGGLNDHGSFYLLLYLSN